MKNGGLVGYEIDRDGFLISENTIFKEKRTSLTMKNDFDQEIDLEMNHLAKKFKDELSTATEYDSSETFKVPKFKPNFKPKFKPNFNPEFISKSSPSQFQEI